MSSLGWVSLLAGGTLAAEIAWTQYRALQGRRNNQRRARALVTRLQLRRA